MLVYYGSLVTLIYHGHQYPDGMGQRCVGVQDGAARATEDSSATALWAAMMGGL